MKKSLQFITFLISICCILNINVTASETSNYVFDYGDKIILIENNGMSYEKAQIIANNIYYNENNDIDTYALACIFGHKLSSTSSYEIEHKVNSTEPRCVEKEYKTNYCTRSSCDYTKTELINTIDIYCCN